MDKGPETVDGKYKPGLLRSESWQHHPSKKPQNRYKKRKAISFVEDLEFVEPFLHSSSCVSAKIKNLFFSIYSHSMD